MPIFRTPETPEEIEQERVAKEQVVYLLTGGLFKRDPTSGRGTHETLLQTYGNLIAIVVVCTLFLTGVIPEGLYVASILLCFGYAIILSVAALYFTRKDVTNGHYPAP